MTPLTRWKTPCTPQKQPPANTAVWVPLALVVASTAGGAILTAASLARVRRGAKAAVASATTRPAKRTVRRGADSGEEVRVMVALASSNVAWSAPGGR